MQLAPLTTAELTRRTIVSIVRGRPPATRRRPTVHPARRLVPVPVSSPSPSPSPAAKRRKRTKTQQTRHQPVATPRALGGERPSRRVLGAPLPRDDASLARRDALPATLRAFQHWPEPSDARRGVTAGNT